MILVTGSTGFVGSAVVAQLKKENLEYRKTSRTFDGSSNVGESHIPQISGTTDWSSALHGVDAVIHCAARAHQMNSKEDSFDEYASVNTAGSIKLAKSCVESGVRRLVFVSTIKVCAETTMSGQVLSPDCSLSPSDAYSRTKADAESALQQIAIESGLELVIVRPPLVYGPRAKGNLELLVRIVSMGLPLPFGAINNRRSIVGLENLANFLSLVCHHPLASGQVFHISDGTVVSTTQVLRYISRSMNKRSLLIPVPVPLLRLICQVTGKMSYFDRLTSNLEVDSSSCFELLDWQAPLTISESIASLTNK